MDQILVEDGFNFDVGFPNKFLLVDADVAEDVVVNLCVQTPDVDMFVSELLLMALWRLVVFTGCFGCQVLRVVSSVEDPDVRRCCCCCCCCCCCNCCCCCC